MILELKIYILFFVLRLTVCDRYFALNQIDSVYVPHPTEQTLIEYESKDPNVIADFSYKYELFNGQRAAETLQIKNVFLNDELTTIPIGNGSFLLKYYSQARAGELFFSLDYLADERGMRGLLNFIDKTGQNVTEKLNFTYDHLPIDSQTTRLRHFYLNMSDHHEYVVSMNIPHLATANDSNFECYFLIRSGEYSDSSFSCSEEKVEENNLIEEHNELYENGNYRLEYTGTNIRMTEKGGTENGEIKVSERELKLNDSKRNFTMKFMPVENGYNSTITFFYSNGTNDSYFYPDTFEPDGKHFYISTNEKHEKIVVNGHSKIFLSNLQVEFLDPTGLNDDEFETQINLRISFDRAKAHIDTIKLEDSCYVLPFDPLPHFPKKLTFPDPNEPTMKSNCVRRTYEEDLLYHYQYKLNNEVHVAENVTFRRCLDDRSSSLCPIGNGHFEFYAFERKYSFDYLAHEIGYIQADLSYVDSSGNNITENFEQLDGSIDEDSFYLIQLPAEQYVMKFNFPDSKQEQRPAIRCVFLLEYSLTYFCLKNEHNIDKPTRNLNKFIGELDHEIHYVWDDTELYEISRDNSSSSTGFVVFPSNDRMINISYQINIFKPIGGYNYTLTEIYPNGTKQQYYSPETFMPEKRHAQIEIKRSFLRPLLIEVERTVKFQLDFQFKTPDIYQTISFLCNGELIHRIIEKPQDSKALAQISEVIERDISIGGVKTFPFKDEFVTNELAAEEIITEKGMDQEMKAKLHGTARFYFNKTMFNLNYTISDVDTKAELTFVNAKGEHITEIYDIKRPFHQKHLTHLITEAEPIRIKHHESPNAYKILFYFRNNSNHDRFKCFYKSRLLYDFKYECETVSTDRGNEIWHLNSHNVQPNGEYNFNYSRNQFKWTENGLLNANENISNGILVFRESSFTYFIDYWLSSGNKNPVEVKIREVAENGEEQTIYFPESIHPEELHCNVTVERDQRFETRGDNRIVQTFFRVIRHSEFEKLTYGSGWSIAIYEDGQFAYFKYESETFVYHHAVEVYEINKALISLVG